mgnify:CR=1 FL=1
MKTAKRFLTAALAVLFTLMCALPALAEDTSAAAQTYTLTITNPAAGHTYEVYQIFAGHHTQDGGKEYLSDIEWGSGVTSDGTSQQEMINKLKTDGLYDEHTTYVTGVNDATKVAMALSKLENEAEQVDKFNEIVGAYLGTAAATQKAESSTTPIQFTNLSAGYYLVKDKNDSVGENESYTKYLVKLVANANMNIKSQSMSLEKHILTGNTKVTANNAAMGDTVNYCLESRLSEMDGYDTYTFIVHDELDAGLTFNDDVAVKIGTDEDNLNPYPNSITVEYATKENGNYRSERPTIEKGQKLYIHIKLNGLTQQYKGQLVSITYSATVNEKANIGNTPNTNVACLEYSNNPNESQQNEQTSTTMTPKTTVSTYVAGIQISKVSPKGSLLPGAQFKIEAQEGTDPINQLNVTGYSFAAAENDSGEPYYKEGDSFVTVAPNESGQKYVAKGGTNLNNGRSIVGMTGDGEHSTQLSVLRFDGLKAGTYTITEVLAPTGYKKLGDSIDVEIEFVENDDHDGYHWSYKVTGGTEGDIKLGEANDGVQSFKIVNQHGLTLPFTGGAGANLLAGVGLALMAATAAAILYIKHRKDRE